MDKFTLLMVLHSHQPVGNFDSVFAQAVRDCYRPVVAMLARYPGFRCGLHFSGPLLSWLTAHDPDLLAEVARLAGRGQVELLSGGYYEPLLAVIPREDALAQVEMQNQATRRLFGQEPKGFWLAERIWEPGLPAKLAEAGLAYTLVDDTHFYYAGLGPGEMFGYRMTEREGHALALFPTHKELRYAIPFQEPERTLEFLHRALDEHGPTCATYGDDSEKFGLWPGTHEWVFKKGWLARFIEAVLAAGDWLATGTPGEFLARNPPAGRVYLPTASYEEMLVWALPAATAEGFERLVKRLKAEGRYEEMRPFLRGGLWDNFLVKYRESNLMHKRMLAISRTLREGPAPAEARDHLLQAQCNCAYWHGLFGGLYLGHLRHAIHQHLIAAEDLADRQRLGEGGWATCKVADVDLDGREEVALATPELDLLVHPGYGGSASVLDLRPRRFNLAGALTRRREAYHAHFAEKGEAAAEGGEPKSIHDQVVFKEEGLEKHLIYDWYERGLFQDHVLSADADPEAYRRAAAHEWGDFIDRPYRLLAGGQEDGRAFCRLARQGAIWAPGGPVPLAIAKDYALGPGPRLTLGYRLAPQGTPPACRFGVELSFSLLSCQDPAKHLRLADGTILGLEAPRQAEGVGECTLVDRTDGFALRLGLSRPAGLWLFPLETVSMSESGLERTYQGSSLTLWWDLPPEGLAVTIEAAVTAA